MSKNTRREKRIFLEEDECSCVCLCCRSTLLPEGIERITDEGLAKARLLPPDGRFPSPAQIAVFDFDGTCINGSSPKKLVSVLGWSFQINLYKLFRIGLWALAYKLNLPKNGENVRTRVFSAFRGLPAIKVNDFLCNFYREKIAGLYRLDADAEMMAHLEAGHVVILVSASFEPIIASAMVGHPIQFALASRMQIDEDGNYTDKVEGLTTEGQQKTVVLEDFANKVFGEGNWEIGWAYADHYSDVSLLSAARFPYAVTPDNKLRKYAESRKWDILEWG